ncbi:MAG: OmpA family protein [Planctomycetes bacterium]|nr:OmpA family protein [Planctomycetota bacterium]
MRNQRPQPEESADEVPSYIVTFSDMVTLLLTFFVMLLSLAIVQDPELIDKGRDSFVKSITHFGLGILAGKNSKSNLGSSKVKYFISNPNTDSQTICIDAKQQDLREIFKQLSKSMETLPSQIVAEKNNFSVTSIRFSPEDATLNDSAKNFLTDFCTALQQNPESKSAIIYVLGLCDEEINERNQWMLSAKRAKAAADFMTSILPSRSNKQADLQAADASTNWPVYSWGAGSGGKWVGQDSPISKKSQILIAVLR